MTEGKPMTIESVAPEMWAKMSGAELISACGQDAMKWAEAFVAMHPGPPTVETAHAWFANAMMTMWDVTNSNATHNDETLLDHIGALIRNRDLWREHGAQHDR